uniref:Uncharacterized protein n=1 Tax=Trichogramma kaykai TaxID=54128 RepID=A0ABD2WQ39_9HYME
MMRKHNSSPEAREYIYAKEVEEEEEEEEEAKKSATATEGRTNERRRGTRKQENSRTTTTTTRAQAPTHNLKRSQRGGYSDDPIVLDLWLLFRSAAAAVILARNPPLFADDYLKAVSNKFDVRVAFERGKKNISGIGRDDD